MSDRIDYLYNAAERIKMAIQAPRSEQEVPALVLAQIATAEATLALAEQQRIANLIALGANAAQMLATGAGSVESYLDMHKKINPEIMEGLGL